MQTLNYFDFNIKGLVESGCDVRRDCDQNAKCESTWVGNQQKYVCQCLSGYSGDGHTCTKLETEVSVINNNIITNWFIWNSIQNIFDTYWIFIHSNNVQCIISNMLKTKSQRINRSIRLSVVILSIIVMNMRHANTITLKVDSDAIAILKG